MYQKLMTGRTFDPSLSFEAPSSAPEVEPERLPDRALDFCRSPQHFLLNLARAEELAARFRLTNDSFAILSDPDAVHAVYNGSQDDYEKGELYDILRGAFGESIFTIDGSGWTGMHAVLKPLFSRQRMLALSLIIAELVTRQIIPTCCANPSPARRRSGLPST
jgi:cytochrome P450